MLVFEFNNSCGQLYSCSECNINYSTYAALLKHMRLKSHSIESLNINKPTSTTTNTNKIPLCKKVILDPNLRNSNSSSLSSPVFILPDPNGLNSSMNSASANGNVNHFAPILLFPINPNQLGKEQSSFRCQANDQNDLIVTQEAGSQTVILNASQYQQTTVGILSMDSFKDYEQLMDKHNEEAHNCDQNNIHQSQQTQTSLHMSQQMNNEAAEQQEQSTDVNNDDYYYLDAATSTSPLLNLEILLNDISTQTNQQNQLIERTINEINRPKYEQASNDDDAQTTHSIQVNFDLLEAAAVSASVNMSTSTYEESGGGGDMLNSSMNSNVSTGSGGMNHNNRCTTPSASNVHAFAACQTEDFYFDASFNANTNNSTQTTKYFSFNVVETQTEWDEYL
jgi:hypothetical protein